MPYHYRNGRLIKIPARTEWGLIAVEVSGLYAKLEEFCIARNSKGETLIASSPNPPKDGSTGFAHGCLYYTRQTAYLNAGKGKKSSWWPLL